MVDALGGEPDVVERKVAPRWGALIREVMAVNMVTPRRRIADKCRATRNAANFLAAPSCYIQSENSAPDLSHDWTK